MELERGELVILDYRPYEPNFLHAIVLKEPWTDADNGVRVTVFVVEIKEVWIPQIQCIIKVEDFEKQV